MINTQPPFAFLCEVHLLFWLFFFIARKDLRKPMLFVSLFFAGAAPIGEFLTIPDYWNPDYILGIHVDTPIKTWKFGLEDWVGEFASAGICVAVFEIFFPKKRRPEELVFSFRRFFILVGWSCLVLVSMMLLYVKGHISGILSTILACLITCCLFYTFHLRYLKTALVASLVIAVVYWLFLATVFQYFYPNAIKTTWVSTGNWGFYLFGIPIEEMVWCFFSSLFVGPLYRASFLQEKKQAGKQSNSFSSVGIH